MIRFLVAALALTAATVSLLADDPPKGVKPTPLGVNTDKDETDPHIASDDLSLYYVTAGKEKAEVFLSQRKKADLPFAPGKALPLFKTKTANVRSVFITPEGKYPQYLFFATDEDFDKRGQKGDNFDLYFYIRQKADADWTTKSALITLGTENDELYPWLSPDGKHIYFSRQDKEGWNIYTSARPGAGQFPEATRLDFDGDYQHPTLTPDGKTMVLQRPLSGKGAKRRWGLFVSHSTGKTWSKPEALTALNADGPVGDLAPNLSRDGVTLYFASDRPGGKGGLDLYSVPLKDVLKKK